MSKLRWLRRSDSDGNRYALWPIRLSWGDKLSSTWFTSHGWPIGCELVPVELTSRGKIPGLRAVYGQTYHLGRLKIMFGRKQTDERQTLVDTWARYQEVVSVVMRDINVPHDLLVSPDMRTHWFLMAELRKLVSRKDDPHEIARAVRAAAGVAFSPGGKA